MDVADFSVAVAGHPTSGSRSDAAGRRILCISAYLPRDPSTFVTGTYQRLRAFVEGLAKLGEIEMLFLDYGETESLPVDLQARLQSAWGLTFGRMSVVPVRPWPDGPNSLWHRYLWPATSIFRQARFGAACGVRQIALLREALTRKPDLVFAYKLTSMAPLLRMGAGRGLLPPVIFDLDDIEHIAIHRAAAEPPRWPTKRLLSLRSPSLILAERRAALLSEATIVCSEEDRRRLVRATSAPRVEVVPNAVALPAVPAPCTEPTLLFLGALGYGPNAAAADYLVGEIWPLIRRQVPEARLVVAGAGREGLAHFAAPPSGVYYTGFVADLADLYARTAVVCCPIRSGSGTRIKILEAAAYARPVVSTTIGAEGIEVVDGETALLRDTTESFAGACIDLLRNPLKSARIGAQARRLAETRYSRDAMMSRISGIAARALSAGHRAL